ncbi:MAG: HK97 family phage prohead protease [Acidimicrobiales bacterium]
MKLADSRSVNTGRREVEVPVDTLGRERYRAKMDTTAVERRADGAAIGFKGHAAMFGKRTWIGPKRCGFWEVVGDDAFTKTLGEADVRFLINHDPNLLLARNKAGTLRLSEDGKGLATDADMAPVSYAQDLAVLLERGDISQMSFAFEVVKDSWEELDDGNELRTLDEVRLWDVSVVTYPAYEDTDAGLRSFAFDALCRSAGIDDAAQRNLLRGITSGHTDPQVLDQFRSATEPSEPAETTRLPEHDQPAETTGPPLSVLQRRHALKADQLRLTA